MNDADLARLWKENRAALGMIGVGFADSGRLINAKKLPNNGPWAITVPDKVWGTTQTMTT